MMYLTSDDCLCQRMVWTCLEVQQDAMIDGYIVSVDYDTFNDGTYMIYCTTIIDGNIWYWDPENR